MLTNILKTGQTADNFHGLGKYFFFRKQLKNFAKIGDNSGLKFFLYIINPHNPGRFFFLYHLLLPIKICFFTFQDVLRKLFQL